MNFCTAGQDLFFIHSHLFFLWYARISFISLVSLPLDIKSIVICDGYKDYGFLASHGNQQLSCENARKCCKLNVIYEQLPFHLKFELSLCNLI